MRKIPIELVREGRIKVIENAAELVRESQILFENSAYSRTIFFSQIIGEELGKYLLLVNAYINLVIDEKNFDWPKFWKDYLEHKYKLESVSLFEDAFFKGIKAYNDYFDDLSRKTRDMKKYKQVNLYVGFTKSTVLKPSDWQEKKMAKTAFDWASGRYKLIKQFEDEIISKTFKLLTKEKYYFARQELLKRFPGL